MEPPNSFDAEAVRAEKARVIEAIRRRPPTQALTELGARPVSRRRRRRPQAGRPIAPSPTSARDSRTETYVALKLEIDNWRWAGVPFYLRTGKALSGARHRDRHPLQAGAATPCSATGRRGACTPNSLVLQIQPDEGISLHFDAKRPGPRSCASGRWTWTSATTTTSGRRRPPATRPCSTTAMIGDQTLFQRARRYRVRLGAPCSRSWTPGRTAARCTAMRPAARARRQADALLARDGRAWRPLGQ